MIRLVCLFFRSNTNRLFCSSTIAVDVVVVAVDVVAVVVWLVEERTADHTEVILIEEGGGRGGWMVVVDLGRFLGLLGSDNDDDDGNDFFALVLVRVPFGTYDATVWLSRRETNIDGRGNGYCSS